MLTFVSVVFAYYFLARSEEKECSVKFGQPFDDYMRRTSMFLPFDSWVLRRLPDLAVPGAGRYIVIFGSYFAALLASGLLAHGARLWSARSLYASYTSDTAIVSLVRADQPTIKRATSLALTHPQIIEKIRAARRDPQARFIVYLMPAQWFMSDLPMNLRGYRGHHEPKDYDPSQWRVLVMKAIVGEAGNAGGEGLLLATRDRVPLSEVTVDMRDGKVVAVEEPPRTVRWGSIPTPLY
jgi:hypothetical protein